MTEEKRTKAGDYNVGTSVGWEILLTLFFLFFLSLIAFFLLSIGLWNAADDASSITYIDLWQYSSLAGKRKRLGFIVKKVDVPHQPIIFRLLLLPDNYGHLSLQLPLRITQS